jgi:hypothetical protein
MPSPYNNPLQFLSDLLLWIEAIKDFLPDFETRMVNRERRFRLRHAEGKISHERLGIELEAIRQKRVLRGEG